ncbi:Tyrosine-protein phosphatase yvh1 [Toxocara canis]|uniref:protein-tyrosine-phosphatase n=1 Tax=Toxocara canis TaxID=6265 RepID=A0A0B2V5Q3_TOXCA|nr:Tyrosine-protein phosphatase yvh1 [Toxocara canis]
MIDKIIDNLYVSDANSVISQRGQVELKKLQVSHILTVSAMGIPERSQIPGVEYKFLFVMDSITQDILANNLLIKKLICFFFLDIGLKFIEDAINDGGTVLVHCEVGMSRSVVFVMAYLMRRYQWSVEKALLHVRTARPIAHPNDGFLRQLQVFQKTGYKADVGSMARSPEYQRWCSMNGIVPITDLASVPPSEGNNEPSGSDIEYRCRKCRRVLFYGEHVLKHATSSKNLHDDDFCSDGNATDECEFGVLLTPMKWMDLSSYEGKILCPSCNEKLGNYVWGGRICLGIDGKKCGTPGIRLILCPSCNEKLGNYVWGGRICLGIDGKKCGTPVRPWVQIHKGKVDLRAASGAKNRIGDGEGPMIVRPPVPRIVEPHPEGNREDGETPKEDSARSTNRDILGSIVPEMVKTLIHSLNSIHGPESERPPFQHTFGPPQQPKNGFQHRD